MADKKAATWSATRGAWAGNPSPSSNAAASSPSGEAKWKSVNDESSWLKVDPPTPPAGEAGRGSGRTPSSGKKWKADKSAQSWITEGGAGAPAAPAAAGAPAFGGQVTDVDRPLAKVLSPEKLAALCTALPKVELHAHLSGTVLPATLEELLAARGVDPSSERLCLDALHVEDSLEKTWAQTVEAFATIRKVTAGDATVLTRVVEEAVGLYAAAGCVYLEIRTGLKPLPDKRNFLSVVGAAIKRAEGRHGVVVRLLVSVDRGATVGEAEEAVAIAIEAFEGQNREHGVVVGVEMGGNPLQGEWHAKLRPLFQRAREAGLRVSLHFAENEGREEEHNSILDFAPDRVGHAVFMSKAITARLLKSGTPVEVCATCHEAFYKVPLHSNVFGPLHRAGHPAILCCDNACLLRTGIDTEYLRVITAFGLTARQVDGMLRGAVGAAFCDGGTRQRVADRAEAALARVFPTLHGRKPDPSLSGGGGLLRGAGAAAVAGTVAASLLIGVAAYARIKAGR